MPYVRKYKSEKRICPICGNTFETEKSPFKKFCTRKCVLEAHGLHSSFKGIPTGTVGTISELAVSIDLLSKGYEVLRSLSPSSSCDILARKDGREYPMEVRTGYRSRSGKVRYSKTGVRVPYLAIYVGSENIVVYEPGLI